jgi:hypothetical protein
VSDDPAAFLGRLVAILDAASVPYMVVGGLAAIAHGRPRTTQDIDVIVVLAGRDARRLVASFPADEWYADEDAAVDAVRHQRAPSCPSSTGLAARAGRSASWTMCAGSSPCKAQGSIAPT